MTRSNIALRRSEQLQHEILIHRGTGALRPFDLLGAIRQITRSIGVRVLRLGLCATLSGAHCAWPAPSFSASRIGEHARADVIPSGLHGHVLQIEPRVAGLIGLILPLLLGS